MRTAQPLELRVYGRPSPGGSKRPIKHKVTGKTVLIDSGGENTKNWRTAVSQVAGDAMKGRTLFDGPLILSIVFFIARPKKHYRGGQVSKGLLPTAPRFPAIAPDSTKLLRSTEDSLKQIVWVDDSRVVDQHVTKRYADCQEPPGARIRVSPIAQATVGDVPLFKDAP